MDSKKLGLAGWVQRFRKAILLLVVVLCFGGFYALQSLPVAIFPDLAAPRIIVTADAGDTPVPLVLANITRPLENAGDAPACAGPARPDPVFASRRNRC